MALGPGRQLHLLGQSQDVVEQRLHGDQQDIPLKRSHSGGSHLSCELSQLLEQLVEPLLATVHGRMRRGAQCSQYCREAPQKAAEKWAGRRGGGTQGCLKV